MQELLKNNARAPRPQRVSPPGIKAFFPSPYVIVQTRVTPWLQPPQWITPYGSVPLVRYSSIGLKGDYLNIHGTNLVSFKEQLQQYQWHIHPVNTTVFERLQSVFYGQNTAVLLSYLNGKKPIAMASKGRCSIEIWADNKTTLWHGTIHHKQKYQLEQCDAPPASVIIDTKMTDMTHWDNNIALYINE